MNRLFSFVRRPSRHTPNRRSRGRFLTGPEGFEPRVLPTVSPFAPLPAPPTDTPILPTAIASDTSFAYQWALQNTGQTGGTPGMDISAPQAWDITTGSRNVVVAVIDSGIDVTHPDLAGNIWTNPGEVAGNGIDDDRNGFVDDVHGWNFAGNNSDVSDGYGHGTHVAGIIGAIGNNGIGVSGVNWQVSIMALRVQDNSGVGYTSAVVGALQYATRMRRDFGINIVVTNNSWESVGGYSAGIEDLIRQQGQAGITFVAAAGNHGTDNDLLPRYPGNYNLPNVISVASLTASGDLAGSSDYGLTTVDLAAPGTLIQSTWKGGGYAALSGTSMAAPQVSGVVALLAAAKPGITVAEVRAAILGRTTPVAALAGKTVTGGRLNAFAALASLNVAAAPVPPPTSSPVVTVTPAPVPAPTVVVAPAVPLPVADTFNRTNGPLASLKWTQRAGSFAISAGAAVSRASLTSIATVARAVAVNTSQRVQVSLGTSRSVGLVARYSGSGDQSMYLAQLTRTRTGYAVQIFRHYGGVWKMLAAGAVGSSQGSLRFDVVGSRLTASFNGRVVAAATDYAIAAAGSFGLRGVGIGGRFDNYSAA